MSNISHNRVYNVLCMFFFNFMHPSLTVYTPHITVKRVCHDNMACFFSVVVSARRSVRLPHATLELFRLNLIKGALTATMEASFLEEKHFRSVFFSHLHTVYTVHVKKKKQWLHPGRDKYIRVRLRKIKRSLTFASHTTHLLLHTYGGSIIAPYVLF